MAKYAALGFGFTATGQVRRDLQKTAEETGLDPQHLRYVEKNGVRKVVDAQTGETVRRLS